eukprot:scaffold1004_cov105-Cylindrotheca_fusiformis.AAC.2
MNTIAIFSKRAAMTLVKQRPQIARMSLARLSSASSPPPPFAVESPEGGPTDLEQQEMLQWDKEVIDIQFSHADEIKATREAVEKMVAVDGPDGIADAEFMDEARWEQQIIESEFVSGGADIIKANREAAEQMVAAVNAPDGFTDAELLENVQWENDVISHAAEHEDMQKIHQMHMAQQRVSEERARDPEHDW